MIPQFFIRLNRMLQSFEPSTGNVGNRMLRRLYILIIAISSRIQPSSRQQFRILTLWTVLIIKNNAGISMNHMAHCYGGGVFILSTTIERCFGRFWLKSDSDSLFFLYFLSWVFFPQWTSELLVQPSPREKLWLHLHVESLFLSSSQHSLKEVEITVLSFFVLLLHLRGIYCTF